MVKLPVPQKNTSYIFVSGGVLSSLGKGTTTASLALLLKSRGYKVTIVKCENYLNIDSGLINPIEHGDPFLCEDGTEADMDLGTYEKYLDQNMGKNNFITMGQIYQAVISKERNFEYGGEDVEAIPHVTDEILDRIEAAGQKDNADIVIVELGGTAGEYQNILYYEASRILRLSRKRQVVHVHVSYLPTPPHIGEPKTKPTQLSVKLLNSMGIQPDFIVARAEKRIDDRRRDRFALFCNVTADHIIDSPDVDSVYELPLIFAEQNIDTLILKHFNLPENKADLDSWKSLITKIKAKKSKSVEIAVVGKYFATGEYQLRDSYAALFDALDHASAANDIETKIRWVDSTKLENQNTEEILDGVAGVIVPIGWGERGVEGKIKAIKYAREKKVPYLGLCYGMQLAVVEYARNVLGLEDAHTTEVSPNCKNPVIHIIPEQERILENRAYGGTMRLGGWDCLVKPNTLAWKSYDAHNQFTDKGKNLTSERHRHRYEFNNAYSESLEKAGLIISGRSTRENLVELIELPTDIHPFFLGTQGHPEYKSTPRKPHALFVEFLKAASKHK